VHKLDSLTIEEYLSIESASDSKHEYHNGYIYAMAGGTLNHGLICGNIYGEIRAGLKENHSDCKAINSEVKLYIQSLNSFLYPDTKVICGGIEQSNKEVNAVTNPSIIVEVLSKTTAHYDRGDKFYFYRQIPSLQE
jgi:Uma2 family endonuclease